LQVSATSHDVETAGRQTVVLGLTVSTGHAAVEPSHLSATSQLPADARQTNVLGRTLSAGQPVDALLQNSAGSQAPVDARHMFVLWASEGHELLEPLQTSAMSHAPADARHVVVLVANVQSMQHAPPSQSSPLSTMPLPQLISVSVGAHTDGAVPVHSHPDWTVQSLWHPSPESMLASSHSSPLSTTPLPHSSPVWVQTDGLPVHVQPSEIWQIVVQPSAEEVFASSHSSSRFTTPLPQLFQAAAAGATGQNRIAESRSISDLANIGVVSLREARNTGCHDACAQVTVRQYRTTAANVRPACIRPAPCRVGACRGVKAQELRRKGGSLMVVKSFTSGVCAA